MADGPLGHALRTVAVSLFTLLAAWRGLALVALALVPLAASFAAATWCLLW